MHYHSKITLIHGFFFYSDDHLVQQLVEEFRREGDRFSEDVGFENSFNRIF